MSKLNKVTLTLVLFMIFFAFANDHQSENFISSEFTNHGSCNNTNSFRPVFLKPRTKEQEKEWANVPVWNPSTSTLRRALPSSVDHSSSIHYRDRYMQCASCCASSSSIGFVLTYQINCIKNTPADQDTNLLAAHHTWNHLNYLDQNGTWPNNAFSIAYWVGAATKKDFGYVCSNNSWIDGNEEQFKWLNGYEEYYRTMHYTTNGQEKFKLEGEEGINKLKNWLYDMGGENEKGACAVFIANWQDNSDLKQNSEGKYYWSNFGNECQHAMTFCGYDDNFTVDFNRDGKITNNIDINRDGKVDTRDREQGAWIISDTRGKEWANMGCVYLPYRFSVYENDIYIVRGAVKKPKYTMKLDLNHSNRGEVIFSIGFANRENAIEPDEEYIRNTFWSSGGGDAPMQGLGLSADMELGLNYSHFENKITSDKATFFLRVESGSGSGMINSVAFRSYFSEDNYTEIISDKTDIALNGNTVEYIFNYDKGATEIVLDKFNFANNYSITQNTNNIIISSDKFKNQTLKFELYNSKGQKLISKHINNSKRIILIEKQNLSSGIYFYHIKMNGQLVVDKFIKK